MSRSLNDGTNSGFFFTLSSAVTINVRPGSLSILAFSGMFNSESNTTRNGWQVSASKFIALKTSLGKRTVKLGSSANTVPIPVIIAPQLARNLCTSKRDSAPVIHWLLPFCSAVRLSRLLAIFRITYGKPYFIRRTKPLFNA